MKKVECLQITLVVRYTSNKMVVSISIMNVRAKGLSKALHSSYKNVVSSAACLLQQRTQMKT